MSKVMQQPMFQNRMSLAIRVNRTGICSSAGNLAPPNGSPQLSACLRVCPGTSCGIAEPSQHEADRGKAEEGERLAGEVLPILGQSTAAVQPSYGAFDKPALREDDKPFRLIRALHDVKVHAPQDLFDRTSELRSLVSAIGVELQQKRIAREEHGHQPNAPVAILDMGGVHDRVHQQALRVDEKVTLLAFDPF